MSVWKVCSSGACREFALYDHSVVLQVAQLYRFFLLFDNASHTATSAFWTTRSYGSSIFACTAMLAIRRTTFAFISSLFAWLRVYWIYLLICVSVNSEFIVSRNMCYRPRILFVVFVTFLFKFCLINKRIRFSWQEPHATYDIASPPWPAFCVAPATPSITGNNSVPATVVVSNSPTMATYLPFQAVVGTSSAQTIVTLPLQALFPTVRTVSSPTQAVASVIMRFNWNRFREDERMFPGTRFRSNKEILRTSL